MSWQAADDTEYPRMTLVVQALIADDRFQRAQGILECPVGDHLERGRLSIDESVTWYLPSVRTARTSTVG